MKTPKGFTPSILPRIIVNPKSSGFSLAELLVAMSIFAAISVVLYSCFRGGIIAYTRMMEEAESQQRLRHLFLTIDKDITNALYISNIPFEGEGHRTSFISISTKGSKLPAGIGRISYYLKPEGNDYSLIRKAEPLKKALSLFTAEDEPGAERAESGISANEEILAEKVGGIKFSYLYALKQQPAPAPDIHPESVLYEWTDFWEEDALPVAIKIEVVFSDSADAGRESLFKRIWIPAARPLVS
jgi:prepilin-type N-terminal cleavage/methylation domain-containing protein